MVSKDTNVILLTTSMRVQLASCPQTREWSKTEGSSRWVRRWASSRSSATDAKIGSGVARTIDLNETSNREAMIRERAIYGV